MTFKTQDELVAFSTGVFIDNASGLITPSNFRDMHEHFADSMIPYDASGVFQISTVPTGSVPTPTPTGAIVFDASGPLLYIWTGSKWGEIAVTI
jgi:anti-sigma-K factor RskA